MFYILYMHCEVSHSFKDIHWWTKSCKCNFDHGSFICNTYDFTARIYVQTFLHANVLQFAFCKDVMQWKIFLSPRIPKLSILLSLLYWHWSDIKNAGGLNFQICVYSDRVIQEIMFALFCILVFIKSSPDYQGILVEIEACSFGFPVKIRAVDLSCPRIFTIKYCFWPS